MYSNKSLKEAIRERLFSPGNDDDANHDISNVMSSRKFTDSSNQLSPNIVSEKVSSLIGSTVLGSHQFLTDASRPGNFSTRTGFSSLIQSDVLDLLMLTDDIYVTSK